MSRCTTPRPDRATAIRSVVRGHHHRRDQYIYQLEEDPYVKGVNLWNVGTIPNVAWVDLTECLGTIGSALVDYYSE